MDHFTRLSIQVKRYILIVVFLTNITIAGVFVALTQLNIASTYVAAGITVFVAIVLSAVVATSATKRALEPLLYVWQAVLHVSSEGIGTSAPNADTLKTGRELVTSLINQIYQFASQQNSSDLVEHRQQLSQAANIVNHMPLPLFVFNKDQVVTHASNAGLEYCRVESAALFGKPIFESLNLEFQNEFTLEAWIKECQDNKVTDTFYWERVHVRFSDESNDLKQCDIIAYYNRDNPSGTEFIMTMFDRTEKYNEDDKSLSFVSLAVHELRTPLTVMRGYVEVFEEELSGALTPELQDFMHKLRVSADQLSAFVNNILKVARVEENQLVLQLSESSWPKVIKETVETMTLRASVHNKTIEYNIGENIPTVGIDKVSIQEVINNLVDNAIKYSGKEPKKIIISTYLTKDGMVETTVQDFGVGIPDSVVKNLFEKFYRNHRTKTQIGGTGLGLYLSKSIVTAHSGHIWVKSAVGEGSTFGFTLPPYSRLADEQKTGNNNDITRSAHGWIKNHSMYRR